MKPTIHIKKVIFIVVLFFNVTIICASPQMPDLLIYKGDTIPIYNLILEQYLNEIKTDENESLFGLTFREGASFNCWRGYQAIYQVENDSLFLVSIMSFGEISQNKKIDQEASLNRIKEIFNNVQNGRVHLKWFSGKVSIPNGELLSWDGVFYKTFIDEIIISIENGLLTESKEVKNYIDDPKKLNRYDYYTPLFTIYKQIKRKFIWRNLPDDGRFWWEDFSITIGKDGSIKEVINLYDDSDPAYQQAIENAIKDLSWDIVKKSGEPIEQNYTLSLEFDFLLRRITDIDIDSSIREQKRINRRNKKIKNNR